jgi:hypothetical protein
MQLFCAPRIFPDFGEFKFIGFVIFHILVKDSGEVLVDSISVIIKRKNTNIIVELLCLFVHRVFVLCFVDLLGLFWFDTCVPSCSHSFCPLFCCLFGLLSPCVCTLMFG